MGQRCPIGSEQHEASQGLPTGIHSFDMPMTTKHMPQERLLRTPPRISIASATWTSTDQVHSQARGLSCGFLKAAFNRAEPVYRPQQEENSAAAQDFASAREYGRVGEIVVAGCCGAKADSANTGHDKCPEEDYGVRNYRCDWIRWECLKSYRVPDAAAATERHEDALICKILQITRRCRL